MGPGSSVPAWATSQVSWCPSPPELYLWLAMDPIDWDILAWAWTWLITVVLPNDHWTVSDPWLPLPDLILAPSCELTSWLDLRFASSPWNWLMIWTLGWNLPSLGLPCLPCIGTAGWGLGWLGAHPDDHIVVLYMFYSLSFREQPAFGGAWYCAWLVGIFFVVPKDSSSYWLRIFLLADSASRAVLKWSV